MVSPLIDGAVITLIHDRLRILHDGIAAKLALDSWGGSLTGRFERPEHTIDVIKRPTERQVLELARRALAILEAGDRAPVAPGAPRTRTEGAPPTSGGTSKFAFLGSTGFDLPSYSDLSSRRNVWMTSVLRGGSPDPTLSHLIAPALEVAFAVVDRATAAAAGDAAKIAAARAFGMGMIGAIASDVVIGPLLRGAEDAGRDDARALRVEQLQRVESAVRQHVFGGASTSDFLASFPSADQVPDALWTGYLQALGIAGGPLAEPRPRGFSDFERALTTGTPLSPARLREAYRLFRNGSGDWDGWAWFFWLMFFSIPVGAILPIAAAPSESSTRWQASRLFRPESPGVANPDDEAWTQLATLSFALSSIGPFVATLWLWGDLPEMHGDFIHGFVGFGLDAIGAVLLGLSTTGDERWDPGVRIAIPIVLAVSRAVFVARALACESPAGCNYLWLQSFPLWSTIAIMLLAWLFDAITDTNDPETDTSARFWGVMIGWWALLLLVQALVAGLALSGKSLLGAITSDVRNEMRTLESLSDRDPPWALAAVLDESTLWSMRPAAAPVPADLRYPPGSARGLLRLWWTGSGALKMRHAGHRFWFRIGDSTQEQVLVLPPVSFTPRELAQWLVARVTGRPAGTPGAAGGLLAEPVLDETTIEAAHRLPWPMVVADTGSTFTPVGVDREHAYVLQHASRIQLATPHGRNGPSVSAVEGWPVAPGAGLSGADGSGVGMAAELGTLLALGAASRMHDGAGAPAPAPAIGPVAQVFRRWNLDARRVNEWRMLVSGGAQSEKRAQSVTAPGAATPPAGPVPAPPTETLPADPFQLPGAAASPAVLQGSEALSNALGWLPLLRAWSRIATDVEQDATSDLPAAYNPRIRAEDGRLVQPTNRQLNEAVRYLLDLP